MNWSYFSTRWCCCYFFLSKPKHTPEQKLGYWTKLGTLNKKWDTGTCALFLSISFLLWRESNENLIALYNYYKPTFSAFPSVITLCNTNNPLNMFSYAHSRNLLNFLALRVHVKSSLNSRSLHTCCLQHSWEFEFC